MANAATSAWAASTMLAYADELSGYVFTPQERFAELATVAQSGRVQIIKIVGTKLRYGSALIHNLSMGTELEDDEIAGV
jgi:hypothetical protein